MVVLIKPNWFPVEVRVHSLLIDQEPLSVAIQHAMLLPYAVRDDNSF
jgi:hypothetical protein